MAKQNEKSLGKAIYFFNLSDIITKKVMVYTLMLDIFMCEVLAR